MLLGASRPQSSGEILQVLWAECGRQREGHMEAGKSLEILGKLLGFWKAVLFLAGEWLLNEHCIDQGIAANSSARSRWMPVPRVLPAVLWVSKQR